MNGKSRKSTILEGLKTIGFGLLLALSATLGVTAMSWITEGVNDTGNYWLFALVPIVVLVMTLPLSLIDGEEGT